MTDLLSFLGTLSASNIPLIAAFFLGLMAAISPCPMATNITAIAYISKKIGDSKHTLLVGILYTLGRMFTYIVIALAIVWVGVKTQFVSGVLQDYGEILLGPFLVIIGILMLGVIKINFSKGGNLLNSLKEKLSEKGLIGGFFLGAIFALAFCPFSAMLYFGVLIPLSLANADGIFIPGAFALATGLPVLIFSLILSKSISKLGKIMNRVQVFEKWMRRIVAVTFIIIGIYCTFIIFQ